MIKKYSSNLIHAAVEFMRCAKEEVGAGLSDEQAEAMLDAFDPALKTQMLMELMMGNIGMVSIKKVDNYNGGKIKAIKEVRRITGFGLKEAKDLVDECDHTTKAIKIPGNYSNEEVRRFREGLKASGYSMG